MATQVIMPKLGLTMTEGTIERWVKQDGDSVEKGEVIMEILTDKASMEVEAPAPGILKIVKPEGAVVPIIEVVGYILEPGEKVPEEAGQPSGALATAPAATPPVTETQATQAQPGTQAGDQLAHDRGPSEIKASPAAKRLARELGLSMDDLRQIKGSGPGGRIVEEDVGRAKEALAVSRRTSPLATPPAPGEPGAAAGEETEEVIPLTGMKGIIAQRMARSVREAPQFHVSMEIAMDQVMKLREELLPRMENVYGVRLSYTEILVKAVARALEDFKLLNSFVSDTEVRIQKHINIGVAVGAERGLVVPTIRDAGKKSLLEISRELKALAQKAREGTLLPDELAGGTFTVSNLGMFGIDSFAAILNPPQAGILAIGKIKEVPVIEAEPFVARRAASLTLTSDHRAVDGVMAARFLGRLKEILEGQELNELCRISRDSEGFRKPL